MLRQGINVILDMAWGSSGKGKLSGFLGKYQPDLVASSFGPNAGHTFKDDNGKATVYKCLPTSSLTCNCPVLILPDSVIKIERLMEEVNSSGREVLVHPRAAVLVPEDAESAQVTGKHLAGTMQGTGHAIARKLLRIEGTNLAKDVLPSAMIYDTSQMIRDCVKRGGKVLMEMSQGFDLSLNHGYDYPWLTSRDITVGAAVNSCGCPIGHVTQVIGCMRTFPIRVGNIEGGWSGPCYSDQQEISWGTVADMSNGPKGLVEKTTVTKRVRRVFTFSITQYKKFCEMNNPDWMFLNFIQYLDWKMEGVTSKEDLTPGAVNFINQLEDETKVPISLIGTGAKDSEIIQL